MKFLGGGKVFYAVIFMRILCLLNYHVKIIEYFHRIDGCPAGDGQRFLVHRAV